jgi:hypothetical protein
MDAAMLRDIFDNFAHPLGDGTYYQFIAAIVINGDYESVGTSFTIWLLDGRRLDSGTMFLGPDGGSRADFKEAEIGRKMYARALEMLGKAVPASKVQQAKSDIGITGS